MGLCPWGQGAALRAPELCQSLAKGCPEEMETPRHPWVPHVGARQSSHCREVFQRASRMRELEENTGRELPHHHG